MKTSFSLLLALIFTATNLQAQVLEQACAMSTGSQPALTLLLPGADPKFAEAEWKEYMKTYGKVVRVKGADENVASDVQILDIGGVNKLKVYSHAEQASDGTKMIVWIDMGSGFVSSEAFPKEYVASVNFLKEFGHKVKVDLITRDLEEQEKALDKSQANLSKLERENENLHKIIEDSKKRIAQAEKDIEENLKNQGMAQKEIEVQKEAVQTVKQKLEEAKKQ
jgi:hypothetical protein